MELARQVATLLSPIPGSMIIGSHGGLPEKGYRVEDGTDLQTMFCHSPESWEELWNGQVFEKGTVKVEATVQKIERPEMSVVDGPECFWLWWSITRL